MYSVGFSVAFFLPKQKFFQIMNYYHMRVNDNLEVIDKGAYFKIN